MKFIINGQVYTIHVVRGIGHNIRDKDGLIAGDIRTRRAKYQARVIGATWVTNIHFAVEQAVLLPLVHPDHRENLLRTHAQLPGQNLDATLKHMLALGSILPSSTSALATIIGQNAKVN